MGNSRSPFSFLRSALVDLLLLPVIVHLTALAPTLPAMKIFESVSLSTVEIIKNNGYAVEVHHAVTQDGYILELHRIPQSKSGDKPTRNHPVFVHHGILGSSADWVLGGANISLPMQLADAGYDVWMANCRGNTYSRKHMSLNVKQKAFWDFSLHEIGKYDLPGSIDYILKNTSSSQLHYIGYSMGSCVFFIMGSERPEYQPMIRSQISLAPVAFLSNTRSTLRYFAPYAKILNVMFQKMSKGMFLPQSKLQWFLANTICKEKTTQKLVCEKCIIFSVCGSDPKNFNSKLIPLIMGHFPAGTSSMLAAHFAQFILKDTFDQYDYGAAMNVQHYNSTEPPSYNLKSIKVPITLIHGENDILAVPEDVMRLNAQLPKVMNVISVNDSYFNHADFLWSLRVNELVNEPVKDILRTTDKPEWRYSGPSCSVETNEIPDDAIGKPAPLHWAVQGTRSAAGQTKGRRFAPGLRFLAEHVDEVVADSMPRTVRETDAADFERERLLQKMLFGDAIIAVRTAGSEYRRIRDDFADEVLDWIDDGRTVAVNVAAGARSAVETRVRKTAALVNDRVTHAGKSVAGGVARAESAVAGGVARAESAVAGGVARAENFVNYGLNKAADPAVGNALVQTVRKAFWFLK